MLRHSLDAANRLTESREWLADPRDSIDTSRVTVMLDEVRGGFAVFNKPLAADTLSSGATVPALLMIMPIPPNSVADLCTACSTAISSAIESKTNIFRACSPGGLPALLCRSMLGGTCVGSGSSGGIRLHFTMLPEIAESFTNSFNGEELADHYGAQKPSGAPDPIEPLAPAAQLR